MEEKTRFEYQGCLAQDEDAKRMGLTPRLHIAIKDTKTGEQLGLVLRDDGTVRLFGMSLNRTINHGVQNYYLGRPLKP